MKSTSLAAIVLAIAFSTSARANTDSPPGAGQAVWWVLPCSTLDRLITAGKPLTGDEGAMAEFCLGAFTAIMAVNYISPPNLPFCVDNDAPIDYVRIILHSCARIQNTTARTSV